MDVGSGKDISAKHYIPPFMSEKTLLLIPGNGVISTDTDYPGCSPTEVFQIIYGFYIAAIITPAFDLTTYF